jgi:hypothetical protein
MSSAAADSHDEQAAGPDLQADERSDQAFDGSTVNQAEDRLGFREVRLGKGEPRTAP